MTNYDSDYDSDYDSHYTNNDTTVGITTYNDEDGQNMYTEIIYKSPSMTKRYVINDIGVSSTALMDGHRYITLSPNNRYILVWGLFDNLIACEEYKSTYNKEYPEINLGQCVLIIDSNDPSISSNISAFNIIKDESSDDFYHVCCMMNILNNKLVHVICYQECYESYLIDFEANKIIARFDGKLAYLFPIVTDDKLYVCNAFKPYASILSCEHHVQEPVPCFVYDLASKKCTHEYFPSSFLNAELPDPSFY